MMEVDPRWYETFFGEDWLRVALHGDDEEQTRKQVDFIVDKLGLDPGARILDLAGGHGRHAVLLAERGFRVTLFDLSRASLDRATAKAAELGVGIEIVEGDMREIDYEEAFDAVLNLFTAFGYFADEADDRRVLDAVARALVPGGAFVLDVVSLFGIVRNFQPLGWRDLGEGWTMLEERDYDAWTGRSAAVWTFLGPSGERRELRHSVRLYTLAELRSMLADAGLTLEGAWLNWEDEEYRIADRGRLIVAARKTLSNR